MHELDFRDFFTAYAMIFGKSHVMTFDGKYYDFVKYAKPDCTYLLGRDFKSGNFTLLVQEEHIIVKTPDMSIRIHQNGRVNGEIRVTKNGVTQMKRVKDLPIETDSGYCKFWMRNLKCSFKQGIKLNCNTDHQFCSIVLSGWHYGKSQGKHLKSLVTYLFNLFNYLYKLNMITH